MKAEILQDILNELKVIDGWVLVNEKDPPPENIGKLEDILEKLEDISGELADMDV